jgi:DNA-binding response OmpR family regulator
MLDDLPVSLTPIQRRMFTVLRDRHFHTRQELHACLDDELAALTSIQFHISRLRAKLRHHGFTISCKIMEGCTYYCLDTYSNGQEKPKPY